LADGADDLQLGVPFCEGLLGALAFEDFLSQFVNDVGQLLGAQLDLTAEELRLTRQSIGEASDQQATEEDQDAVRQEGTQSSPPLVWGKGQRPSGVGDVDVEEQRCLEGDDG
jgi:hypothetical protein